MKIGIVGSRTFTDYNFFKQEVERLLSDKKDYEIISGGATGADSMAKKFAISHKIKITEFFPDWDRYGKAAGPIRNKKIAENSDAVIAFWDGKSKGTKDTIDITKQLKKPLKIIMLPIDNCIW